MTDPRIPLRLLLVALALEGSACRHDSAPTAAPAERELVRNTDAKPGDTTVCPYSGRPFVVTATSPTFEYEGRTWVLCSEKARDAVAADPERYLRERSGAPSR